MPQIVMRDPVHSHSLRSPIHRSLAFANRNDNRAGGFICPFSANGFKERAHFWNHRHETALAIFGSVFWMAPHRDLAFGSAAILPSDILRLADSESAVR